MCEKGMHRTELYMLCLTSHMGVYIREGGVCEVIHVCVNISDIVTAIY